MLYSVNCSIAMTSSPTSYGISLTALVMLLLGVHTAEGSSVSPDYSDRKERSRASAIVEAEVVSKESFHAGDGGEIWSRSELRVISVAKGKNLPEVLEVFYRGGKVGDLVQKDGASPDISVGDVKTFYLAKSRQGKWRIVDGNLGVKKGRRVRSTQSRETSKSSTSALNGPGGVTASEAFTAPAHRFPAVDSGQVIPVLLDLSTRPAGISEAQALTAVKNALAAWENNSEARFYIEETTVFPRSASSINNGDGKIRLQLHDNYNEIPDSSSTLGVGGSYFSGTDRTGGEFGGNAFRRSSNGYVVLNHPRSYLSNALSLEEVLTHEIGHVLGLAHSSEVSLEINSLLKESIMYFQAHGDGRGASLNQRDLDAIVFGYPLLNRPPFASNHYILAVTKSSTATWSRPEVNQVQVAAGDLDGEAVSLELIGTLGSAGTFSRAGSTVTFIPAGNYSDNDTSDPANGYFARYNYRPRDAAGNYGAVALVSVIGLRNDSRPSGNPDGLPDSWMTRYFGSISPVAGTSQPRDDPDGDGLSNLEEFLLGTNPRVTADGPTTIAAYTDGQITWTARPYKTYQLQSSSNLTTWTTIATRSVFTAGTEVFQGFGQAQLPGEFYRLKTLLH